MLLQHRDQVSITIMSHSKENLEKEKIVLHTGNWQNGKQRRNGQNPQL